MAQRVVVLGAGYAGLLAARSLARRLRGRVTVTVVNDGDHFVERLRLHQVATGQPVRRIRLSRALRGSGARLVIGSAVGLDAAARAVRLEHGREVGYDVLVCALGSRSAPAPEGVLALAGPAEAAHLRSHLAALTAGTVAVVGGGLTGIEAAAEIAEHRPDLEVVLVSRGRIDADLAAGAGRHLRSSLRRLRITVRERTEIASFRDGELIGIGADGAPASFAADLVVWSTGFRAHPWAESVGLSVDELGRMLVDDRLRSVDDPRIYGIGDAAAVLRGGGAVRMSCQVPVPSASWLSTSLARMIAGRSTRPHRPRFVWRNTSLGRRNGITQFTRSDDSPLPLFLHGRASAAFKEAVTRGVLRLVSGHWPADIGGRAPTTGRNERAEVLGH